RSGDPAGGDGIHRDSDSGSLYLATDSGGLSIRRQYSEPAGVVYRLRAGARAWNLASFRFSASTRSRDPAGADERRRRGVGDGRTGALGPLVGRAAGGGSRAAARSPSTGSGGVETPRDRLSAGLRRRVWRGGSARSGRRLGNPASCRI